ncbi:MAG TPA: hypothetical protein VKP30_02335, partial [Polyangiaceae bacterium]|nr:hypothetical protein [Polyangiaceae bacterium]
MRQTTSAASVRMMRPIAPGHDATDHAQLARRRFAARTCPSLGILWLALLANTACGAHNRGNCELTCDPSASNQCPDGLVCGNQKYCVADQTVVCESSVGGSTSTAGTTGPGGGAGTSSGPIGGAGTSSGPIGGGTHSTTLGVGGTSSQVSGGTSGSLTTTGGAATGGATTDGGSALLGGNGGTASTVATAAGSGSANLTGGMGGTTPSTVSIAINPTSPWCVGVAYNATMIASGGGPDYSWRAANLPAGMVLGVSTTASNTLTGMPQTAGVYEPALTVTDTLYQGQLNLTVNDRPSVTTTSLADACLGEVFSTKLAPNDPSQLEWAPEDLPKELGLTLELDGTLHGVIRKTGTFELKLSVRNKTTGCSSAAKTLQLKVYGEDAPSCPTIRVKGQTLLATPAPASCVGWPYSAQFEVFRGSSPPSWRIVEEAAGYVFDSTTQTLTNNDPTQDASVTLQISDGVRQVQRQFSIPLRKKCWLGYVDITAPESGAPYRLNLVDPLLGARLVSPITDPSDSVEDFKFSPDGRFVA